MPARTVHWRYHRSVSAGRSYNPPTASLVTSDLHAEFEAQTQALLRRRFLWFAGVLSSVSAATLLVIVGVTLLLWLDGAAPDSAAIQSSIRRLLTSAGVVGVGLAASFSAYLVARSSHLADRTLLRLTYALVILDGILKIVPEAHVIGLVGFGITHVVASAFLPWRPSQATLPLIPVVALYVFLVLSGRNGVETESLLPVFLCPLAGLPGVLICWLRDWRRTELFQLEFFRRRYGEVRRELIDAKRLHESLFPPPIDSGPIRLAYAYEPMRQIGGDFVFSHHSPASAQTKSVSLVLLDVTGHGISAALTVNRLSGELSRVFAEHPDIAPGDVLRMLNRYVYLTLANHSVFATAMCIRVQHSANTMQFASGGHPPAYLCASNGTIHELPATTVMLGVLPDDEFHPDEDESTFTVGDAIIAFTDGALEARAPDGRMLGLSGIRKVVANATRHTRHAAWCHDVLSAVTNHRNSPPGDDTLIVVLSRPADWVG